MKLIRKYLLGIFVIFFIATNCSVQTPVVENFIPALKASAVQPFIIGSVIRWMTLTNEKTPYTYSDYSSASYSYETYSQVAEGVYLTNFYTNSEGRFNVAYTGDYSYFAQISVRGITNTNGEVISTSNEATFFNALSNAYTYDVTATIYFTNGTTTMKTIVSNLKVTSFTENPIYSSSLIKSIPSDQIPVGYYFSEGNLGTEAFQIYHTTGITLNFRGSHTNNYENVESKELNAYIDYEDYLFKYTIENDQAYETIASIVDFDKYEAGSIPVNLLTGE